MRLCLLNEAKNGKNDHRRNKQYDTQYNKVMFQICSLVICVLKIFNMIEKCLLAQEPKEVRGPMGFTCKMSLKETQGSKAKQKIKS